MKLNKKRIDDLIDEQLVHMHIKWSKLQILKKEKDYKFLNYLKMLTCTFKL